MKKPKVFISYSRQDSRFADCIVCEIKNAGGDPWLDREQIKPGDEWPELTLNTLKASDYTILILSRQSVNSKGFVQEEFLEAIKEMKRRNRKYIFTFKTDDCEIPEPLRHLHSVSNRDNGIAQIIRAMGLQPPAKSKCNCFGVKTPVLVFLTLLILAAAGVAYWYYNQNYNP
ncbi:MAG: toll/interleukin-1 receptor domain-containing protein [Bacteroidia bacterium]|jgi:hypothetical protein|nr:toll/interleukin-1 receptor domain-containing protein [Bacteroidia bacterium]